MESDPKSAPKVARAVAQPIVAPLSRAAIFLVATLKPGADTRASLRSFCGDLSGIFRAVEYRNIEAGLSCICLLYTSGLIECGNHTRPPVPHFARTIRLNPPRRLTAKSRCIAKSSLRGSRRSLPRA